MATTVYVSPGSLYKRARFYILCLRIGITKLGLVGLTLKGPAFEPIRVSTTDQFFARFGQTSTSLQLPYVANLFTTIK